MNIVQRCIYGEVEWDRIQACLKQWAPFFAGVLFGAGWWCMVDAIVYSQVVQHETFPLTYYIPGGVATLALILMNIVSREELMAGSDVYAEEGADSRARCWLFFAYTVAVGSIGGAVAVLVNCVQQHQHIAVGVGGLLQTGLIIAASLLLWAFRSSEDSSGFVGLSY